MKLKTTLLLSTGLIIIGAGIALATPIAGLVAPILAVGQQANNLRGSGTANTTNGEPFMVAFQSDGAATFTTQMGALSSTPTVTAHNGWHSHPGMVFNTLITGEITWYDADCNETIYKQGDSWVEGSQVHAFKVNSPSIQFVSWYVTAKGEPVRTDESAPECDKDGHLGF